MHYLSLSPYFSFIEFVMHFVFNDCRYFKYVLFPVKAISKAPAFFTNYQDKGSDDCMYTEAIMKAWNPVHWPSCGWYMDCPLKNPPTSEIVLRETLQPALKGKVHAPIKIPREDLTKKARKRKPAKAPESINIEEDDIMVEDQIPTHVHEKEMPFDVPSSSNIEEEMPATKRQKLATQSRLQKVMPSNTGVFDSPPKRRSMRNILPQPTKASCSELILNDSFLRIVQEKQKKKAWPQPYEDIMSFLSKVRYFLHTSTFI
jgi:transcription initiation factor IIF auxiliary subunit